MRHDGLMESPAGKWTRAEDYVAALARRRTARRQRQHDSGRRSEPETPRMLLSTLPFAALLLLLGVVTLGIIIAAIPVSHPQKPAPSAERQQGVAAKGWLQEAEKDFHRQAKPVH